MKTRKTNKGKVLDEKVRLERRIDAGKYETIEERFTDFIKWLNMEGIKIKR